MKQINKRQILRVECKRKGPDMISERISVLGLWCLRHSQQYFSCIEVISFIGGGNRNTRRKTSTCRKSLTNILT